jgi:hypothetical protein
MTKEQLQELYESLQKVSADFNYNHSQATHGRNLKIRKDSERRAEHDMIVAKSILNRYPETMNLLTKGAAGSSEAFILDEFNQSRYFGSDLSEIIRGLRSKIDEDNT